MNKKNTVACGIEIAMTTRSIGRLAKYIETVSNDIWAGPGVDRFLSGLRAGLEIRLGL